ncbi:MAG: 4Fe-4S dicluster domain-containing protein [Actinobacteria bacterium]|nr:4Fe-4S dicluster domain-containing protein [Actinomycetota bacterium]
MTEVDERVDFGVFDAHRPPSADLIADCVHCGFCLPTCPTYALWGEEMDSPRGRIYLMQMGLEGEVEMDDTFVRHLDLCLGCMACVTACPSGVQYDRLIEATRPQLERNYPRGRGERLLRRLIFWLFPHPRRLWVAALLGWLYRALRLDRLAARTGLLGALPEQVRTLESLLPDVHLADLGRRLPEHVPARGGPARARVGLVTGCVQSVFFADVNAATARVLALEGCDVIVPGDQPCCGALELHSGNEEAAIARAKAMIEMFEDTEVDAVVINAAGCGSSLKEYATLLRDEPGWAGRALAFEERVRDVSELLDELGPRAERHPVRARVAYQDACHLQHAQQVRRQPRRLLADIPGVELSEIMEPEICCGSAGIYNLLHPQAAADLGRRKADHVLATEPDVVCSGNPGCLLQLQRHLHASDRDVRVLHTVQLLDASLRGDGLGRPT